MQPKSEPMMDGGGDVVGALKAHGVEPTPESILKVACDKDYATLHDVFRQGEFTKDDFDSICGVLHPNVCPTKTAALSALAGMGIASAALPLAQIAKEGQTSWKRFVEAAPRTTATGFIIGGLVGAATALITNARREEMRRQGSAYFEKQDRIWAKR